jgi:hypothetical protein
LAELEGDAVEAARLRKSTLNILERSEYRNPMFYEVIRNEVKEDMRKNKGL